MPSFHPSVLENLHLDPAEMSSLKLIAFCRGRQEAFLAQEPEVLESLRLSALVESTESSNRLEGIVTTRQRLEGLVLHSTKPKTRDEEEIKAYRDALAAIHARPLDWSLDEKSLLGLHATLFRTGSGAGRWKKKDNLIIERLPSGEANVRFRPTPAAQTPKAMEQLILGYQIAEQENVDPLVRMILAVLDFLCVHPFSDGNGRISRLLTTVLCYEAGYEVGRFVSLERVIEQNKERYYENLRLSSIGWHEHKHDVHPFLNFMLFVLAAAYREFEQRVQAVKVGRGSKSQLVTNAILMQTAPFSLAEIRGLCPAVSQEQIKLVMQKLKAAGKIKCLGRGRDAKWHRKH